MSGDREAVVTPFMQDGTYPPRNFATFGPSGLQPPFTGTYFNYLSFLNFILQHRAGVRLYTSYYILQRPVFLVNSSYLLFFVTHLRVFLLPKLRNYFAEFLHSYFLVTLVYSTFSLVSVIVQSFTISYLFSILFSFYIILH